MGEECCHFKVFLTFFFPSHKYDILSFLHGYVSYCWLRILSGLNRSPSSCFGWDDNVTTVISSILWINRERKVPLSYWKITYTANAVCLESFKSYNIAAMWGHLKLIMIINHMDCLCYFLCKVGKKEKTCKSLEAMSPVTDLMGDLLKRFHEIGKMADFFLAPRRIGVVFRYKNQICHFSALFKYYLHLYDVKEQMKDSIYMQKTGNTAKCCKAFSVSAFRLVQDAIKTSEVRRALEGWQGSGSTSTSSRVSG